MQGNGKGVLPTGVEGLMQRSVTAFQSYGNASWEKRSLFLKMLAAELEAVKEALLSQAHLDTHWEKDWLGKKLGRTCQILKGEWPGYNYPHPGPAVAFCAAPFPFGTSLDPGQLKALAGGCTLVNVEHPSHAGTSQLVAGAVEAAIAKSSFPQGLIISLNSKEVQVAEALVSHPATAAVCFDGPAEGVFPAGLDESSRMTLFGKEKKSAAVFLLPGMLEKEGDALAAACAAAISRGGGQSYARPGIVVAVQSKALDQFKESLGFKIAQVPPAPMLHPGLARHYQHRRADMLALPGVSVVGTLSCPVGRNESIPTLAGVEGSLFLGEVLLQTEVFGPFCLLVQCRDNSQFLQVAEALQPRTACSLFVSSAEEEGMKDLRDTLKKKCMQLLFNRWPEEEELIRFNGAGASFDNE